MCLKVVKSILSNQMIFARIIRLCVILFVDFSVYGLYSHCVVLCLAWCVVYATNSDDACLLSNMLQLVLLKVVEHSSHRRLIDLGHLMND
jgi:hypothetical protein